jgi:hypothetical protein
MGERVEARRDPLPGCSGRGVSDRSIRDQASQEREGAAAPRRWPSRHLQPQLSQRLTISLQPAALQQLLLGQQPPIELIHPRQALLDCGDHILFQDRDLFLSIGLLDPGATQRQPAATAEDLLHRAQRGFEQQERILLGPAEGGAGNNRGVGREHGHDDQRRERRSDGTDPSRGLTSGRPQTGEAQSKPLTHPFST